MAEPKPTVSFEDFQKLDIRVAKVLEVRDHPNADKLLCMTIDLGEEQRQIVAGLKPHVAPESLLGKEVVVVTNLQPRKVRGEQSNGMLLAAACGEGEAMKVVILTTDAEVPPGSAVL